MQQVPAVEIDGITLSQSVSPQTLYYILQKPYSSEWLECECKQFLTHTAGSNPVHRWDQVGSSAPSSRPKETSPGSDDKWSHRLWNTACAGGDRPVQMIRSYFRSQKSTSIFPGVSEFVRDSESWCRKGAMGSAFHRSWLSGLVEGLFKYIPRNILTSTSFTCIMCTFLFQLLSPFCSKRQESIALLMRWEYEYGVNVWQSDIQQKLFIRLIVYLLDIHGRHLFSPTSLQCREVCD